MDKGKWIVEEYIQMQIQKQINDVLDKIKTEIEQLRIHKAQFITDNNKVCIDSQEVLNVIDKYKVESEDKEWVKSKQSNQP